MQHEKVKGNKRPSSQCQKRRLFPNPLRGLFSYIIYIYRQQPIQIPHHHHYPHQISQSRYLTRYTATSLASQTIASINQQTKQTQPPHPINPLPSPSTGTQSNELKPLASQLTPHPVPAGDRYPRSITAPLQDEPNTILAYVSVDFIIATRKEGETYGGRSIVSLDPLIHRQYL